MEILKKLPKRNGYSFANEFLGSTWEKTIKYCKNFYKQTDDFPFRYSELSSSSALLAGMTASGASVLPEVPGSRKHPGEKEARGRIDAWAMHNSHEYYIEFKHCWYAIHGGSSRLGLLNTWNKMKHQVSGMSQTLSNLYEKNPFWVCGMMIIPTYKNSPTEDQARAVDPDWEDDFRATRPFMEADWVGHWQIPDKCNGVDFVNNANKDRYSFQPTLTLLVTAEYVDPNYVKR